jgi:hypothetical protein
MTAATARLERPVASGPTHAAPGPPTPWRLLVLACLAGAALSLLGPDEPTYDPWSWIIWGREILHLDLVTTMGPSWKPLPVLFTTPFALFGSAAPQLWVLVARAGGLLSLAMAYRLATRLARSPLAGVLAAGSLFLADQYVRNFAMANSEGLLVALCLWAVERHLDHRPRDAFVLLTAGALLRPELWPFWGLYGLWMAVRAWPERTEALLLVCAVVLVALLWFVPEYLGSGNLLRAAARAREANPDSAAYAPDPFAEVFRRSELVLTFPVYLGALIATARALITRDVVRLALAAAAAALMITVAAMTQVGFAGNLRYVALPASIVCVLAGVGWVDVIRLGRRVGGLVVAALLAVVLLAWWSHWYRPGWTAVTTSWQYVEQESDADDDIPSAVAAAGGPAAIRRCGTVYTGPFHTPPLAWALDMHLDEMKIFAIPPGTIIAGRRSWLAHDPRFTPVAATAEWRVLRRCGRG